MSGRGRYADQEFTNLQDQNHLLKTTNDKLNKEVMLVEHLLEKALYENAKKTEEWQKQAPKETIDDLRAANANARQENEILENRKRVLEKVLNETLQDTATKARRPDAGATASVRMPLSENESRVQAMDRRERPFKRQSMHPRV